MDALYSDALCLTGNPEDAADLVEAAYVRAFECYDPFRRGRFRERLRTRGTLAWLYRTLHAAFCDRILAQARCGETPNGDCP
jgi:DNA-directed RNA polymerase specialized sigma24 family protein